MGEIATAFDTAFRDFVVSGNPGSGRYNPIKSDIRALGTLLEDRIHDLGFSPLDYNAVGDGVADDTAEIQAASDAAKAAGGALIFPSGYTFGITGNVYVDNGVKRVVGLGGVVKILASAASSCGIVLRGKEAGQPLNVTDCDVTGLIFDCNNKDALAIYGQTPVRCRILDNKILNCTGTGAAILMRGFINGAEAMRDLLISRNEIHCATTDDPPQDGIQIDGQINFAPYASQSAYWKGEFTIKEPDFPPANIKISDNRVEGGYYGIGIFGCKNTEVSNNTVSFNTRGITGQNGCNACNISDNTIIDCRSSAVHLAYGSSYNKVHGNFCYTTRSSGQALFQAYVNCQYNDFNSNRSVASTGTGPQFHCYAAIQSSGTSFRNGYHKGKAVKAYISIESGWDSTIGNNVSQANGDTALNNFTNADMADNIIEGNTIDGTSAVPAIALVQVTAAANYALLRPVVADNKVIGDAYSQQILLLEEGSGFLTGGTLVSNLFNPGSAASKFVLPRGRAHFAHWDANVTIDSNAVALNFTAADTTPSVAIGYDFKLASVGAVNVTMFDDGADGQEIRVRGSGNDTLVHNASFIKLKGAVNALPTADQYITLRRSAGVWIEINRSF